MVKPMPPYFLVSIPRQDQITRKEKIGNLYLHPTYVFMTRNMQCGQIVAIGKTAAEIMPDAKIGDTLLFHHFVEKDDKYHLVDQDEDYNYYVVTAHYHNGQNIQTYGIWDGKNIIAHPAYIFLETEEPAYKNLSIEEFLNKMVTVNDHGLIEFKEWKVTRSDLLYKMQEIKGQIQSLAKSKMKGPIINAIREKENQLSQLSSLMNKKRFLSYNVVAVNPEFSLSVAEAYGCWITTGSKVYMLNIACETIIEFNNKEYIVAKSIHFAVPHSWIKKFFRQESNVNTKPE